MARCDLHLHSRFSATAPHWVQRRAGMRDSYSEPEDLYRKARAAGMDFVTLTDHDTLEGCARLEGHAGFFPGVELTARFPDGIRVHILVWGLHAGQFASLTERARDLVALRDHLLEQGLAHAVAHPLSPPDPGYTADHFEKLLLLFDTFEVINAQRNRIVSEVTRACLAALTPERFAALAGRHGIAPASPASWRKRLVGGSNDHAGLFVARAYTEAPRAKSVAEFLDTLRTGEPAPAGRDGEPASFASTLYGVVHHHLRHHLTRRSPFYASLLERTAERFLSGRNPTAFSFPEKMEFVVKAVRTGGVFELLRPNNTLARDLTQFFNQPGLQRRVEAALRAEPTAERRSFAMASELTNALGFQFFEQMVRQAHANDFTGSLQSGAALIPVAASIAPYFIAFHVQAGANRPLLDAAAARLCPQPPPSLRNERRAWLTDTLEDVNGVARTIRAMTAAARAQGRDLTILTSRDTVDEDDPMVVNFRPVGEFELPEYQLQKLSFPPVLQMIDHIERAGYGELILSTPGPVGLVGLLAARLLGLRTSGIYHTDFPQYIHILCDDSVMESLTWNYMHWFYGQLDRLYSNSRYYADQWRARGIPDARLRILPRGLDTELFNPRRRDPAFWPARGIAGRVVLYVGRVSREKQLDLLPGVARALRDTDATLAIVGDGPFREELQRLMPDAVFTGVLTGPELGAAYASADVFIFPSTTDTYGNVVVEAAASGLPCVVSTVGGPKELLRLGLAGAVVPDQAPESYAAAIRKVLHEHHAPCPIPALIDGWDTAARVFWSGDDATRVPGS
jgi:glycosyltransferase involved in cell wall biosynthesis